MRYLLSPTDKASIEVRGLTGSYNHALTSIQFRLLKSIIEQLHLNVEFVPIAPTVFIAKLKGFVIGLAERKEYTEAQTKIKEHTQAAEALRLVWNERPKVVSILPEAIKRFGSTLKGWPEICEVGEAGERMETVPTPLVLSAGAYYGVRFWPVLFTVVVSGRPVWAITPPTPFDLSSSGIRSLGEGHPHVYLHGGLCAGDAKLPHGNPFQLVHVLREWYVGYNRNSLANTEWVSMSKQWWRANAKVFFKVYDTSARVIKAPWRGAEASLVAPLTRELVSDFLECDRWVLGTVDKRLREAVEDEKLLRFITQGQIGRFRYQPNEKELRRRFGEFEDKWSTQCKLCGELLEQHWGLTCSSEIKMVLPPEHELNTAGIPLPSRFDFEHEDIEELLPKWDGNRVWKGGKSELPKGLQPYFSLMDAIRRAEGRDDRRHWLNEVLRKFGYKVVATTLCIDCGAPWGEHQGPECGARPLAV